VRKRTTKQVGKVLNIIVKCKKCGREGKLYIGIYKNSRICRVIHYVRNESGVWSIIHHYYSCIELEKELKERRIDLDKLFRELEREIEKKLKKD